MKPKSNTKIDLIDYFNNPVSPRQKQYEIIRAIVLENTSVDTLAKKFGYKKSTIYALFRDAKTGRICLFPSVIKGPQKKQTPLSVQEKIILLRKQSLSTDDIYQRLHKEDIHSSTSTIERILKAAGFDKLARRTNKELGKSKAKKEIPERVAMLDFSTLKPFDIDTPCVGVFFFLPYILESNILDVVTRCQLPSSSEINAVNACLSMLLLKLMGCHRLSHVGRYDQEPGLGVFAGINILPKATYMNTYSCLCSETQLMELQNNVICSLKKQYPEFYQSDYINLDFHSIPHYGDRSEMEKVWCGAKGKTMKGANTVFAQDSQSNAILYCRADILRKEEADEVKRFVDFWKGIQGNVDETLVFDCKFSAYKVLDDLAIDKVKFITLRKRHASLIKRTLELPDEDWQKVFLAIPKRKYKRVSVHESKVNLKNCQTTFRQIAVKDHGRSKPTFILTNNWDLPMKDILEVYAKRWRVENKLAELISFFNLNALSSPLMVRIHFDILWTIIADTLYHRFAQDLRRFENVLAPQLFRKFIDMPGRVIYDENNFQIKIRKRAHTPILKELEKLTKPIPVPWLEGKTIEIIWTA